MIRADVLCKSWPQRPLADVVTFLDNRRKPITESERVAGPYPYYGANGLQGMIDEFIFSEPTILLAEDGGHFGSPDKTIAYQVNGKYWVNNHAHVLEPKGCIDIRFLCRQLETYDVTPFITGTTRGKLTKGAAERIPVVVPPLSEQKRIAGILDQADGLRRKRQQALALTDQFLRSTFLDLFGDPVTNPKRWPIRKFGEVCDSRLGKMLDAKQQTGRHCRPYLRNLNVQWGRLDLSTIFEMDFDDDDRREFSLQSGDVMICEGGAGVGQTAIWRGELEECYFQKSLHRVRPNPVQAVSEYIAYLMWMLMKGSAMLRSLSSATIPHLTGVRLKELDIPVPPITVQQQFRERSLVLDTLRVKARRSAAEADALFNSLVQRAFRGEL